MPNRAIAPDNTVIRSIDLREPVLLPLSSGGICYLCPQYKVGVIRFELFWPVGNLQQQFHYQAKAALQLAIAGTKEHSAEDILDHLETLGAEVQVQVSGMSSSILLSVSAKHFDEAFSWLMMALENAVFPDAEVENFIQVESAELLRKMQGPGYWSKRILCETMYEENSPMARFASPESLTSLDRNNIQAFYNSHFSLHSAHVFLSGDVDNGMSAKVIAAISSISGKPALPYPLSPLLAYQGKTALHKMPHANQVSVMLGKHIQTQDSDTLHKLTLLNGLLGGFFGSRLMQEIREEKGLTYGIGSYIEPTPEGNRWVISGEMNSDNAGLAHAEMLLILDSMHLATPTGDELEKAKRYISGQIRGSFDGPFAWPAKLRQMILRKLDFNHYRTALEVIWSTDTDELCALADNLLAPDSFCTAMAGQIKTN